MTNSDKPISTAWNSNLTYAIGLITADGYLSSDGRHLEFTSKDKEQVENFRDCLNIDNTITKKTRAQEKIKKYHRIQFGDVKFYKFLESIGLKSRKSKTLGRLKIPDQYFPDFLRGFFDGDGDLHSFRHPESKNIQIRLRFGSASPKFVKWLKEQLKTELNTTGFIDNKSIKNFYTLAYSIKDSTKILNYMYYSEKIPFLSRKYQKAKKYIKRA